MLALQALPWLTRTSPSRCSTPVWSGVISLLNNARIAAGKPQLGFLNPLLYSSFANINNAICT